MPVIHIIKCMVSLEFLTYVCQGSIWFSNYGLLVKELPDIPVSQILD